jgi:hypothetical protein
VLRRSSTSEVRVKVFSMSSSVSSELRAHEESMEPLRSAVCCCCSVADVLEVGCNFAVEAVDACVAAGVFVGGLEFVADLLVRLSSVCVSSLSASE